MTIFLLWYTNHRINDHQTLAGVYKNKEKALKDLQEKQNQISVEIIEFHIQETTIKE